MGAFGGGIYSVLKSDESGDYIEIAQGYGNALRYLIILNRGVLYVKE
jgi:hypothetical protein